MKVLAERANGFLYVGPFIIILSLVYCISFFNSNYNPDEAAISFLLIFFDKRFLGCLIVYVICLIKWTERLMTPKIMIEYDNVGLYIYKYKFSQPITVRFDAVCSAFSDEDLKEIYYRRSIFTPWRRISNPTWGAVKTGTLRLELPVGFITLHGVKNVNAARYQITKLMREKKREQQEEIDKLLEAHRREREAEEQKKHDPNT